MKKRNKKEERKRKRRKNNSHDLSIGCMHACIIKSAAIYEVDDMQHACVINQ
jgi:hypothetical protein